MVDIRLFSSYRRAVFVSLQPRFNVAMACANYFKWVIHAVHAFKSTTQILKVLGCGNWLQLVTILSIYIFK